MLTILPLIQTAHAADDGGGGGVLMGVMCFVVGGVLILFSGARAEQQAARLGQGSDSGLAQGGRLMYIAFGVLFLIAGLLMVTGLFTPGSDGQPGQFNW